MNEDEQHQNGFLGSLMDSVLQKRNLQVYMVVVEELQTKAVCPSDIFL